MEACRNVVEHLADGLVDLMDGATAAGTGLGFHVERQVLPLEMIRQTEPLLDRRLFQHLLGRDRQQRCLGACDIGVEILEPEIELILVETLGPAPERAALQDLDQIAEPVDLGLSLGALVGSFRHERADHLIQHSDVGRQGIDRFLCPEFTSSDGRSGASLQPGTQ